MEGWKWLKGFFGAVISTCHSFVHSKLGKDSGSRKPWSNNQRLDSTRDGSIQQPCRRYARKKNKKNKGWELNLQHVGCRAASSPLVSYPRTWQHLSGVWHSPHRTKHNDLLLYCYSTVKDSWRHPRSPQHVHRGMARSFHDESPCGDTRTQRGFAGYLSTVAPITFSWILTDFLLCNCNHKLRPPCLATGPL